MHVLAAQYRLVVLVLYVRKLLRERMRMVLIDYAKHGHHLRLRPSPFLFNEGATYKIAHGLAAVGVAVIGHPTVKSGQQVLVYRKCCPCQFAHIWCSKNIQNEAFCQPECWNFAFGNV